MLQEKIEHIEVLENEGGHVCNIKTQGAFDLSYQLKAAS
jgi:hypothetical protein